MKNLNSNGRLAAASFLVALNVSLLFSGCASSADRRATLDAQKVSATLPPGPSRERWERAEAAGAVPPLSDLPKQPKSAVRVRQVAQVKEPQRPARRPKIPKEAVADVQEFSTIPISEYRGPFEVTRNSEGLIVGRIRDHEAEVELHYRLPGERQTLPVNRKTQAQLILRSGAEATALQRLVVLHRDRAPVLIYIAEGSEQPYRRTLEEVQITIEQLPAGDSVASVKITRGADSITLKPGESKQLPLPGGPLNIRLIESSARTRQQTLLTEGQQHYVNLIAWQ